MMAALTYKQREKLEKKSSNFALPKKRKYPLVNAQGKPSRSHAANAKARATQMYAKGKLTGAERAMINRKADRVLAMTASKKKGSKKKKGNPSY